jgi:hypothetical protein
MHVTKHWRRIGEQSKKSGHVTRISNVFPTRDEGGVVVPCPTASDQPAAVIRHSNRRQADYRLCNSVAVIVVALDGSEAYIPK